MKIIAYAITFLAVLALLAPMASACGDAIKKAAKEAAERREKCLTKCLADGGNNYACGMSCHHARKK